MANDASRVGILNGLLTDAGIPVDGIGNVNINVNPVTYTIQYNPSATAEQIATGDQIAAQFDWRRRRKLSRNTIVTGFQSLTTAQQNAILRHMVCVYLRDNPTYAAQIGTFLGTPVAVDEVDPT